MSCFGLKGGIGTASRRTPAGEFSVGALVLANFGRLPQLVVAGQRVGERLARSRAGEGGPEKGSIILLLATDAPLDARQLRRLAMRAAAGLARTGSVFGHGSGDIALAFSTAYTVPHLPDRPMPAQAMLHETRMDDLFEAGADACEQAILHALWRSATVTGRDGHRREALADLIGDGPLLPRTS
jgi:D-aminopeptidase